MSNANDKEPPGQESPAENRAEETDLAAEVRRGRKFSLSEAVGRAGAGNLKGGSPVAATEQLLLAIDEILNRQLVDHEGSLARTILAQLTGDPPLLARHLGDPVGALRAFLDLALANPQNLADLVRQTDARWGRDYDERPIFERNGEAPDPTDPYTVAGVGTALTRLRQQLSQ